MHALPRLVFLVVWVSSGTLLVAAQHHHGHHVHHHGTLPLYDTSTEETLEGTVEEAFQWDEPGCADCDSGVHVYLEGRDVEIHLGPLAYLESAGCKIREGDAVRVVGSRLPVRGDTILLARELHCGEQHVALRDELGRPLWNRPHR